MHGFQRTQCERDIEAADSIDQRLARVGGEAGRHIDRDRKPRRLHQRSQRCRNGIVDPPRQPRPENGIEHNRRRRGIAKRFNRPIPAAACLNGGLARRSPRRRHAYRDAVRAQNPRRDIAVAAIIARSAQHQHRCIPRQPPHRLSHARPGALHQRGNAGSRIDRALFRRAHFGGGQDRLPCNGGS